MCSVNGGTFLIFLCSVLVQFDMLKEVGMQYIKAWTLSKCDRLEIEEKAEWFVDSTTKTFKSPAA